MKDMLNSGTGGGCKGIMIGIILTMVLLIAISGCALGNLFIDEEEGTVAIEDVEIGKKCLACHGKHPKILTPTTDDVTLELRPLYYPYSGVTLEVKYPYNLTPK